MRRAGAAKREVLPDPKYGSRLVAKFVNIMMIRGKKSTAERIMYDALVSIEDRSKQDALKMFKSAIDNVKPAVEVKSRRVGGSTYQVPVEVRPDRPRRSPCAGSSAQRAGGPSGAWRRSWPASCSTPPATGVPR
jgi:small subunit ribosomal protein S7